MSNDPQTTTYPSYDVMAVNIKSGARRVLWRNMIGAEAEALMSIMRRGACEEFFLAAPARNAQDDR